MKTQKIQIKLEQKNTDASVARSIYIALGLNRVTDQKYYSEIGNLLGVFLNESKQKRLWNANTNNNTFVDFDLPEDIVIQADLIKSSIGNEVSMMNVNADHIAIQLRKLVNKFCNDFLNKMPDKSQKRVYNFFLSCIVQEVSLINKVNMLMDSTCQSYPKVLGNICDSCVSEQNFQKMIGMLDIIYHPKFKDLQAKLFKFVNNENFSARQFINVTMIDSLLRSRYPDQSRISFIFDLIQISSGYVDNCAISIFSNFFDVCVVSSYSLNSQSNLLNILENVSKFSTEKFMFLIDLLIKYKLTENKIVALKHIINIFVENSMLSRIDNDDMDLLYLSIMVSDDNISIVCNNLVSNILKLKSSDLSYMTKDSFSDLCNNHFVWLPDTDFTTFNYLYGNQEDSVGTKILKICENKDVGEVDSLIEYMNDGDVYLATSSRLTAQDFANCQSINEVYSIVKQKVATYCRQVVDTTLPDDTQNNLFDDNKQDNESSSGENDEVEIKIPDDYKPNTNYFFNNINSTDQTQDDFSDFSDYSDDDYDDESNCPRKNNNN